MFHWVITLTQGINFNRIHEFTFKLGSDEVSNVQGVVQRCICIIVYILCFKSPSNVHGNFRHYKVFCTPVHRLIEIEMSG